MDIGSGTAFPVLKELVELATGIIKNEYSLWRDKKIEEKEKFQEANKKLRMAMSTSMRHMESAVLQLGPKRVFYAMALAENVTKITYELDKVAEEIRDILPKEVYDATKNLADSFSKWQTELNIYKTVQQGKTGSTTVIPEDMNWRSYSPGGMLDVLKTFFSSLEDLC